MVADFIFAQAAVVPDRPMDRQPALESRWNFPDPPGLRPHLSGKPVAVGPTPRASGEVLDLGQHVGIDGIRGSRP